MSEKPSYLGLLNAISVGERDAGEYLAKWAEVTPSPDVRNVIHTIALARRSMAWPSRSASTSSVSA